MMVVDSALWMNSNHVPVPCLSSKHALGFKVVHNSSIFQPSTVACSNVSRLVAYYSPKKTFLNWCNRVRSRRIFTTFEGDLFAEDGPDNIGGSEDRLCLAEQHLIIQSF